MPASIGFVALFTRIARTLARGLQNYSQATVESKQGEKKRGFWRTRGVKQRLRGQLRNMVMWLMS